PCLLLFALLSRISLPTWVLLFPYTTLFRSLGSTSSPIKPVFHGYWADSREEEGEALDRFVTFVQDRRRQYPGMRIYHYANYEKRSEEHTSELQSRFDLVCRLLLEKKN